VENVFSARFLPYSGNQEVVSCAADGQVRGLSGHGGDGGDDDDV